MSHALCFVPSAMPNTTPVSTPHFGLRSAFQ